MTKEKTIRTAGLGTRIQAEIHQAAKVYAAQTGKSLAELIEDGLSQQIGLGRVTLSVGIIKNKLRETALFSDSDDVELDETIKLILKFSAPGEPSETVQSLFEEYAVWKKLHDQATLEWSAGVKSYAGGSSGIDDIAVANKFKLVSAEILERQERFLSNRIYPLLEKAIDWVADEI